MAVKKMLNELGGLNTNLNKLLEKSVLEKFRISLSINELIILRNAVESNGSITSSEVSKEMRMKTPQVSNLLKRLEEKGVVRREHDKVDRRQVFVVPTDVGREVGLFFVNQRTVLEKILEESLDNEAIACLLGLSLEIDDIYEEVEKALRGE